MIIKKVSLNGYGLKGAEVHYLEENKRSIAELTKKYPKDPVPLSIEKLFKELRGHLLATNGYPLGALNEAQRDSFINRCHVHTLECTGDVIVVKGEFDALSDKQVSLSSPKMQDGDDYDAFEQLNEIATNVLAETVEYLAGNRKVTDEEVILRFGQMKHKEEEFTLESIQKLTDEQKKQLAITIIEKGLGGSVLLPTDLEPDSDVLNNAIAEVNLGDEISIEQEESHEPGEAF